MFSDKPDFKILRLLSQGSSRLSSADKKLFNKILNRLQHEFLRKTSHFGFGAAVANLRKKRAKT
jgi:hypothetical protein